MKKYIDEALYEYSKGEVYPFHMPGHKRSFCPETLKNPYEIDITEITGFDNLHHAEGILLEAQKRVAKLYHADKSFYLINGSTAGLLSAISACTSDGGSILMARNCHKAAYHAVYLRRLHAHYLYPAVFEETELNGGITPKAVEEALNVCPEIEAVLITSPSYDGMVSDIAAISEIVHAHQIPLIVDEAHGAHLRFSDTFPESALENGADIVIQSLHKTLPSLTQTALLHTQGSLVSEERLKRFLSIYQSSSPSYVFMSSMDACIRLLESSSEVLFKEYTVRLKECRRKLSDLKHLHLVKPDEVVGKNGVYDMDCSKIIISTKGTSIDGEMLREKLLDKYQLEMEMTAPSYVLALSSVMDSEEGFARLAGALLEIDSVLDSETESQIKEKAQTKIEFTDKDAICTIAEAMDADWEEVDLKESEGRVSTEFAYLYPPGIPCIVPGERVTKELIEKIESWKMQGLEVQGLIDYHAQKIRVQKR